MTKSRTIGTKEYEVQEEGSDVFNIFEEMYPKCEFYGPSKAEGAKFKIIKIYPNVSRTVAARIVRANARLKLFANVDYVIEISGETWDSITDDVRKILMLHELNHVYVTYKKDGSGKLTLKDHDVQDFMSIIKEHGIDWFANLGSTMGSLYFEKEKEDNPDFVPNIKL